MLSFWNIRYRSNHNFSAKFLKVFEYLFERRGLAWVRQSSTLKESFKKIPGSAMPWKPLEKSGLEPAVPNRLADGKHCALSTQPNAHLSLAESIKRSASDRLGDLMPQVRARTSPGFFTAWHFPAFALKLSFDEHLFVWSWVIQCDEWTVRFNPISLFPLLAGLTLGQNVLLEPVKVYPTRKKTEGQFQRDTKRRVDCVPYIAVEGCSSQEEIAADCILFSFLPLQIFSLLQFRD